MAVTVANTAANLSGDTLVTAENAETLTGQKTFSNTVLFSPDNTYDIGASGANRPRDVFIADDLTVGDAVSIGGTLAVTGAVTSTVGLPITYLTSTTTGAANNHAFSLKRGINIVKWTGTSAFTPTGFDGGAQGDILIIQNRGVVGSDDIITIAHDSASSDTDNQCQNLVTSVGTPIAPGGFIEYLHDGTDWKAVAHETGEWVSFTPSLSGWTLGNGTSYGAYRITGKTALIRYGVVLGSTSAVGGSLSLTLPFTAKSTVGLIGPIAGTSVILDSGTATFHGAVYTASTAVQTTVVDVGAVGGVLSNISSTVPMVWATNDEYHAAATVQIT